MSEQPQPTCWEPLEATPEALTALTRALGVSSHTFVPAWDWEALEATTPLVLLYPTLPELESFRQQREIIAADATQLYFMRQIVGGACGTVAVLHALMNGVPGASLQNSPLVEWRETTYSLDKSAIQERSTSILEHIKIREAHNLAAATNHPPNTPSQAGIRQGRHFVTFIHQNGLLWELDGRRNAPQCLGDTTAVSEIQRILQASHHPRVHLETVVLALVPIESACAS